MGTHRKYTKEFLEPYVQKVTSIRQLIKSLGLQETGGNYANLKKIVKELDINTSHFTGRQGWSKGRIIGHKHPIEEYFNGTRFINSDHFKKRLIKEGYFDHKCYKCNKSEWFDIPIPLELHHIDCNHSNNQLDNLTILCPNCHSYIHKTTPP